MIIEISNLVFGGVAILCGSYFLISKVSSELSLWKYCMILIVLFGFGSCFGKILIDIFIGLTV